MIYIICLIISILFAFDGYIFYKLNKRAKMEMKWWQVFWSERITVWTAPMYVCFMMAIGFSSYLILDFLNHILDIFNYIKGLF